MAELMVMRLADMTQVHPEQDNSRVCGKCGHRVGIFPSGQLALKRDPELRIVCHVCAADDPRPITYVPAPGSLAEIGQTKKKGG